jgi:hypothetical protein
MDYSGAGSASGPRSGEGGRAMEKLSVALLALTFLTVSGCESTVHGNGVFGVDTRSVPAFDGVSIGLGIVATVRAGATDRSVTISGDQNVLQYIKTDVADGVLTTVLSGVDSFDSVHQIQLVVATPTLVLADAWGSEGNTDVAVTSIDAASFTVSASEGSVISIAAVDSTLRTNLSLTASGTSTIDAIGYPVADATSTLSGGSSAEVTVTGTVDGALSEGSTLSVYGGGTCSFTPAPGTACQLFP